MKRSLQVSGSEETESCDECSGSAADSKEQSVLDSDCSQTRHHLSVACQQLIRPSTHCIRHQSQYVLIIGNQ